MMPAIVLVPFPGTAQLNVFFTGGCCDPQQWVRGHIDNWRMFENMDEATAVCGEKMRIEREADHYVVIARGGLFDN